MGAKISLVVVSYVYIPVCTSTYMKCVNELTTYTCTSEHVEFNDM